MASNFGLRTGLRRAFCSFFLGVYSSFSLFGRDESGPRSNGPSVARSMIRNKTDSQSCYELTSTFRSKIMDNSLTTLLGVPYPYTQ